MPWLNWVTLSEVNHGTDLEMTSDSSKTGNIR